jgi:hypothetical protein
MTIPGNFQRAAWAANAIGIIRRVTGNLSASA